jgi:hypothetical protein
VKLAAFIIGSVVALGLREPLDLGSSESQRVSLALSLRAEERVPPTTRSNMCSLMNSSLEPSVLAFPWFELR